MWDETTYQFPYFNDAAVNVWEDIVTTFHTLLGTWLSINAGIEVHLTEIKCATAKESYTIH